MPETSKAPTIFYSYSHRDEKYRDDLASSLALLKRQGLVREWYDRDLVPGEKWEEKIFEMMNSADLILLLVTRDLINSDSIWGRELKLAMNRDAAGDGRVIPIVVRPTDWQGSPLGQLQALPKNAKPITLWKNRDSAWLDVANGIRKAIADLEAGGRSKKARIVTPVTAVQQRRASTGWAHQKVSARKQADEMPVASMQLRRTIYTANNKETLTGRVARREGEPPTGDISVDEAYEYLGTAHQFFKDVFDRDSIDGNGMPLEAIVHYGKHFNNGFWNGRYIILGDGDGQLFNRFSIAPEVVATQFSGGVIEHDTDLEYWQQSGAIINSLAIVFATMVKQYWLKQTTERADWLIGDRLLGSGVKGKALFSLAKPGNAYDDPVLGRDKQPAHMRKYVKTDGHNGGVYVNTGILNHAFYLMATALGGHSWERAGRVWYDTMRDKALKPKAQFRDFARLTHANATRLFGRTSAETRALKDAWAKVGLAVMTGRALVHKSV